MLIAWIDLLAQELGFVSKSEQREALELLLRGKDVFCVLPTGFEKSIIYQMFVYVKSSSSSVQRPTVIVISPVWKRGLDKNTRLLPYPKMLPVPMNCFLCRVDYALEENVLTEQMWILAAY